MGNNAEIRQRMETYRTILLVLNWIGAVALIIVGIVLVNSRYTQGIGIGVIIGSGVLGIIGHFLINVALAIPFILLNNGDILESMKSNSSSDDGGISNASNLYNNSQKDDFAQIKIQREKTFFGNVFGMDIFIDEEKVLTLAEGEEKYIYIKYGEHKLSAIIKYGSKIYSRNDGINIDISLSKRYNYSLKEHGKHIEINNI